MGKHKTDAQVLREAKSMGPFARISHFATRTGISFNRARRLWGQLGTDFTASPRKRSQSEEVKADAATQAMFDIVTRMPGKQAADPSVEGFQLAAYFFTEGTTRNDMFAVDDVIRAFRAGYELGMQHGTANAELKAR